VPCSDPVCTLWSHFLAVCDFALLGLVYAVECVTKWGIEVGPEWNEGLTEICSGKVCCNYRGQARSSRVHLVRHSCRNPKTNYLAVDCGRICTRVVHGVKFKPLNFCSSNLSFSLIRNSQKRLRSPGTFCT